MGLAVAASMSDNLLNRIPLNSSATYARTDEGTEWDTADRPISPWQLPRRGEELGRATEPVRLLLLRRLPRADHGAGRPQGRGQGFRPGRGPARGRHRPQAKRPLPAVEGARG